MKQFTIILKSHCAAPDFERTVVAKDWYEAAHMIMKVIDLDIKDVVDNMICDGEVKETSKETIKRLERAWL
jgi:predicted nucleic acid-binding Zn finger protein